MSTCNICEKRRPRRYCPGVRAEICSRCCGEEREDMVYCPFDCEYLQEARRHEKLPELKPDDVPNKDVEITDQFLHDNTELLLHACKTLFDAAVETHGVVDSDVREALESLIRTHRTLESGLYYQTRPNNPLAGAVQQRMQDGLEQYRRELAERSGVNTVRDKDFLGVLAFLQRLELQHNNGRPRSRAYLDFLRSEILSNQPDDTSPLIV